MLDPDSARVLRTLGETDLGRRFVLVGGTALTLQLGHRVSRDLDLFTAVPSTHLQVRQITGAIRRAGLVGRAETVEADQVILEVDGVPVTFLAYPFRFLCEPLRESGLAVAHPRDIAIMKAHAMGRCATARDYIDLAYLLDKGVVDMAAIVEGAKAVLRVGEAVEFSERLFLQQLVFTADLKDKDDAIAMLLEPGWSFERVEDVLRRHATAWAARTLEGEGEGL